MSCVVYEIVILCVYCYSTLTMPFIEVLFARKADGRSIRKILEAFGVIRWSTLTTPLDKLDVEQTIAILFTWARRELKGGEEMIMRVLEEENHNVYAVTTRARKGCLYIAYVCHRPDLKDKQLYYWPPNVTLLTLTLPILYRSIEMADRLNGISDETAESTFAAIDLSKNAKPNADEAMESWMYQST